MTTSRRTERSATDALEQALRGAGTGKHEEGHQEVFFFDFDRAFDCENGTGASDDRGGDGSGRGGDSGTRKTGFVPAQSPLLAMLAVADALVVTPDSVSMVSEAVAAAVIRGTGAGAIGAAARMPVLLFGAEHLLRGKGTGAGGGGKLQRFHRHLLRSGMTEPLPSGDTAAAAAMVARCAVRQQQVIMGSRDESGQKESDQWDGGGGDTERIADIVARQLMSI